MQASCSGIIMWSVLLMSGCSLGSELLRNSQRYSFLCTSDLAVVNWKTECPANGPDSSTAMGKELIAGREDVWHYDTSTLVVVNHILEGPIPFHHL